MLISANMYLSKHYTDRLLIRPLEERDIDDWKIFLADKEFHKFFAFDPSLSLHDLAKQWIDRQMKRYKENTYGLLALTDKETGAFIGQAGLIMQDVEDTKMLEIGYHLLPQYRRKGLASEAAIYFKEFAFANKLSDTIVSMIHVDNVRSQQVAERNGMRRGRFVEFRNLPIYIYEVNVKG